MLWFKKKAQRKTLSVIEIDGSGRPKQSWRQWFAKVFKLTAQLAALYAFMRTWGVKALLAVVAFAATAGAAVVSD